MRKPAKKKRPEIKPMKVMEAIIIEARNRHDDVLRSMNWDPEYGIQITLMVKEIRALNRWLKQRSQRTQRTQRTKVTKVTKAMCGRLLRRYPEMFAAAMAKQEALRAATAR